MLDVPLQEKPAGQGRQSIPNLLSVSSLMTLPGEQDEQELAPAVE